MQMAFFAILARGDAGLQRSEPYGGLRPTGDSFAAGGGVMNKAFDCVAMKDGIQKRLLKQMKNLSCEQQHAAIRSALERSRSPIGKLWRALESRETKRAGCVAERGTAYGAETRRKRGPA